MPHTPASSPLHPGVVPSLLHSMAPCPTEVRSWVKKEEYVEVVLLLSTQPIHLMLPSHTASTTYASATDFEPT